MRESLTEKEIRAIIDVLVVNKDSADMMTRRGVDPLDVVLLGRQLVDAAQAMGESPAKLVEALVVARSNNLTDVVTALEKKLGVVSKAESPEGGVSEGKASS